MHVDESALPCRQDDISGVLRAAPVLWEELGQLFHPASTI